MSATEDDQEKVDQEYRVVSGRHRTSDGEVLTPGDTFTPTRREVEVFGFKLQPVENIDRDVEPADTTDPTASATEQGDEQASEEVGTDTTTALVPAQDDRDTLVGLAKAYPGDSINGNSSSTAIREELSTLSDADLRSLYEAAEMDVPETPATETEG